MAASTTSAPGTSAGADATASVAVPKPRRNLYLTLDSFAKHVYHEYYPHNKLGEVIDPVCKLGEGETVEAMIAENEAYFEHCLELFRARQQRKAREAHEAQSDDAAHRTRRHKGSTSPAMSEFDKNAERYEREKEEKPERETMTLFHAPVWMAMETYTAMRGKIRHCLLWLLWHADEITPDWQFMMPHYEDLFAEIGTNTRGRTCSNQWMLDWHRDCSDDFLQAFDAASFFEATADAFFVLIRFIPDLGDYQQRSGFHHKVVLMNLFGTRFDREYQYCIAPREQEVLKVMECGLQLEPMTDAEVALFTRRFVARMALFAPVMVDYTGVYVADRHSLFKEARDLYPLLLPALLDYYEKVGARVFKECKDDYFFRSLAVCRGSWGSIDKSVLRRMVDIDPPRNATEKAEYLRRLEEQGGSVSSDHDNIQLNDTICHVKGMQVAE